MASHPATPAYNEATSAYAGFWNRFGAALIDGILLGIVTDILLFLLGLVTGTTMSPQSAIGLIGYIMAAFTPKKQALHDIIAGTPVVKTWQFKVQTAGPR